MGIFDFLKPKKNDSVRLDNKTPTNKRTEKESKKVTNNDIKQKDGITYLNGEKYTGLVEFGDGNQISEYKEGEKINNKHFFKDGTIKTMSEIVNGELIEIKGWIKIDKEGNYDENGGKILVREYKDGKKIEYYKSGTIMSESDVNRKSYDTNDNNTFTDIKYYENGNLRVKEVFTKYDETGNNGGIKVEYQLFYETGELKKEKVEDTKYPTKYISYYRNKSIKTIFFTGAGYDFRIFILDFFGI